MKQEPTSIFYILGKKAGYWLAAYQHHMANHLKGNIIRRLPGGSLLLRMLR